MLKRTKLWKREMAEEKNQTDAKTDNERETDEARRILCDKEKQRGSSRARKRQQAKCSYMVLAKIYCALVTTFSFMYFLLICKLLVLL